MTNNPIDIKYIDSELEKFFHSLRRGIKDPLLTKYRSRFLKQQEAFISFEERRKIDGLSVAKKLEILCTYADFTLTKIKR